MGWTGGTEVFNAIYPIIKELGGARTEKIVKGTEVLIQTLWNLDWDTEMESTYFGNHEAYIVQAVSNLDSELYQELFGEYMDQYNKELRKRIYGK